MRTFLILIILFFKTQLLAQEFNFITEQDFSPPLLTDRLNEDRNYTMGVSLNFSSKSKKFPLIWLRKKISSISRNTSDVFELSIDNNNETNNTFSISGTAFTPDDLREKNIIKNDRPYAFLLSLGVSQKYLSGLGTGGKSKSYSLNVGIFGTNIGKIVQTAIHRSMNENNTKDPYNPEGWANQINNKKYIPVFMYKYKGDELIFASSFFESYTTTELMIGYYTGIGYGIGGRIGIIDNSNWSRSNNMDNVNKTMLFPSIENRKRYELYINFLLKGNLIPYNYALNGGILVKSPYTLKMFSESNPFLLDGFVGIGTSFYVSNKTYFNLEWKPIIFKSPEMWGNKISRMHVWGLASLTFTTF